MSLPSLRTAALLLESLIFTVVVPGTVTVLIPALILPGGTVVTWPSALPQYAGVVLGLAGVAVYFWCLWNFVATGRGIPAPLDHARHLIVRGLYRYVRNPMYLGVLCVLLGEVLFFRSTPLLAYVAAWWLVVHLFVVFHEEPTLRAKFGADYDRYATAVHRWIPGRPYEAAGAQRADAHVGARPGSRHSL